MRIVKSCIPCYDVFAVVLLHVPFQRDDISYDVQKMTIQNEMICHRIGKCMHQSYHYEYKNVPEITTNNQSL